MLVGSEVVMLIQGEVSFSTLEEAGQEPKVLVYLQEKGLGL